ncbi:hypothetical protein FA13DRAFT_1797489 [Coprinellus micaceus]|uniref:Uncharacterized protein n=1 Tax=Coprinellus micaceus TaxID=71717 RepID=A0A4Y7SR56_COPMI|nr:hypothetical protein FA13DRAFT_1797489 [Coprinellus micaceus]
MPNPRQNVEDPRISERRLSLQTLLVQSQRQVVYCLQTQETDLCRRFRSLTDAGQALIIDQCVTDVYTKFYHLVAQLQSPLPSDTELCNELYAALAVNIDHPEAVVL